MTAISTGIQTLSAMWQNGTGLRQVSFAAGHLCFLLLSLSITCGLLAHTRWLGKRAQWWLDEAHSWAGAWTVYTGLLHALLLHFDGHEPMGWARILLPSFGGGHQGVALALGIYGLYAFITVTLSGYMLGAIKGYLWRWIHWLSFPAWLLSLVHVLLLVKGMPTWEVALYGTSVLVVLGLTGARFLVRKPAARKAATAA